MVDRAGDLFHALVEHSTGLIALLGPSGELLFANRALERVLGVRPQDCLGRSLGELLLPEDVASMEALLRAAIAAPREPVRWELRARHADGGVRWLEGSATSHLDDASIAAVLVDAHDVTERRRAEEALRSHEEFLRQAVKVSGIGAFDHDQTHDTLYWSPRQREIFGLGLDDEVSLARFLESVHPDDIGRIGEAVRKAHDPAGDGVWEVEHRIVRPDGTARWVVSRSQTYFAGVGAARRPIRTVGVTIDQTERKLVEQDLRIKDQVLATSQNAIAIADAEGRMAYVNAAFVRLWGYDSDAEILGRPAAEFSTPAMGTHIVGQLLSVGEFCGEAPALRRDGSTIEVMVVANSVRDASGRPVHLMSSFLDLSESKRLQAQFVQAQKMESVGRLAGGVAHDFNNLLTVMKGYLDLGLRALGPDAPGRRELQEVVKAADSAAALTHQLLAFSRKQVIAPKVLDLDEVIERVQKMLARLLGEDIELYVRRSPALWPVRFDPAQSEQVLVNLAVNARDAMPAGGKLFLETANVQLDEGYCRAHPGSVPGDYVMLAVSDTGEGIADDVLPHIFEPFFTTKDVGSGTGLGLAMVYGAVSQNGGRIEVYSEAGKGTTFKIYLPRVESGGLRVHADETRKAVGGSETILLVEDDERVRGLATKLLEAGGYVVLPYAQPLAALTAIDQRPGELHLLVTDVVMPAMNGRELAARIRTRHPHLPVLFVSGYTADVLAHHGVLAEGVDFLAKPYTLDMLLDRVRELLDRKRDPAGGGAPRRA